MRAPRIRQILSKSFLSCAHYILFCDSLCSSSRATSMSLQGALVPRGPCIVGSVPLPVMSTASPLLASESARAIAERRSRITSCFLFIPAAMLAVISSGFSSYGSSFVSMTCSHAASAMEPMTGRFHLSRPPPVEPSTQIFFLFA